MKKSYLLFAGFISTAAVCGFSSAAMAEQSGLPTLKEVSESQYDYVSETDTTSVQPDRILVNGFNESANISLDIRNYEFSVPGYFNEVEKYYVNEGQWQCISRMVSNLDPDTPTAALTFVSYKSEYTEAQFHELNTEILKEEMPFLYDKPNMDFFWRDEAQIADMPIYGLGFRHEESGINQIWYIYIAYDPSNADLYLFKLQESADSTLEYSSDFFKILNSAVRTGYADAASLQSSVQDDAPAPTSSPSSTPTPAPSSVYSDDEISRIGMNLVNAYNAAVPYIDIAYDFLSNGHSILATLSGVIGLDNIVAFWNAAQEFYSLDFNVMTPAQQSYYSGIKVEIDTGLLERTSWIINMI